MRGGKGGPILIVKDSWMYEDGQVGGGQAEGGRDGRAHAKVDVVSTVLPVVTC